MRLRQKPSGDSHMDYVKEYLRKLGLPLTRENYLRLAYGDKVDPTKSLGAELEAELPEFAQIGFEGWIN